MATDREVYVRLVVPSIVDPESQRALGVIGVAYRLKQAEDTEERLQAELAGALAWFECNLRVPDRFNRTTSKGWYRRETRGLSWFRATAEAHLDAARALLGLLARAGLSASELRTHRPGYVMYEDAHQVVAEPFRETPTR